MAEKRLLIIHHGALGDLVATFPALVRLNKRYDGLDVLCQGKLGKLAQSLGIVRNWLPLEASSFASLYSEHADSQVNKLLRTYHDIVVFSFSSHLKTSIEKHTGKIVHLISPRPDVSEKTHVAAHIFAGLAGCGLLATTEPDPPGTLSPSGKGHATNARQFNSKKVLIHPGSGSRRKLWPLANFLEVHRTLRSDGFGPEFLFGPAEHFLVPGLMGGEDRRAVVHVVDEMQELLALLAGAGAFIGNDSGVSHLAAFMGIPTVAVFGPSDPERWKPVGRRVEVVRPDLDCSPCFETDGNDCEEKACFNGTSPETVLSAFHRIASNRSA